MQYLTTSSDWYWVAFYVLEIKLNFGPLRTKPVFPVNVQWTLSFVTPSFSRDTSFQATQNLVAENFLRNLWIFYFYQCSTEGTPLFREGHFSLDPKPGFDLQSGDTLAVKKWLITKIVDKFKCLLVTMVTAFKTWTIPFLMMYCTYGNSTPSVNIAGR